MRKIKLILFMLLASLISMNVGAAVVGDVITRDGLNYRITDLSHNEVAFTGSNNSGMLDIPATVKDSVNIEWTVTRIANNSNVPNATSVTIPNTVNAMEAGSLNGSKITSVTIPASVQTIDNGVFSFCLGLQEIIVNGGNPKYYSANGVLYEKDGSDKWLVSYPVNKADNAFNIPDGVSGVRPNAFQQSKNLETVNLPQCSRNFLPQRATAASRVPRSSKPSMSLPVTPLSAATMAWCSRLTKRNWLFTRTLRRASPTPFRLLA